MRTRVPGYEQIYPVSMSWVAANWALVLALALGVLLLCVLAVHAFRASSHGQLRRVRKALAAERRNLRRARARVARAQRRRAALGRRADKIRPRDLREATEALADAEALAKIASDNLAIAENHLRRVILEEFPPARHERLRMKYLPDRAPDGKPFTF